MLKQEMSKELEKKMRKVVGDSATILTVITDDKHNKSLLGLFRPSKGPTGRDVVISCAIAIHGIFKLFEDVSGSKERAREIINQIIDDEDMFNAAMQDGPNNPFVKDEDINDLN